MNDWRPVRDALERAYGAIGETHSGSLPERDWKLAAALREAFVEQSERTCYACLKPIPYRAEIVCLDCSAPLHKECAAEHFWPNGRPAPSSPRPPPMPDLSPIGNEATAMSYEELVARLRGPLRKKSAISLQGTPYSDWDWAAIDTERAEAATAIETLVQERDEAMADATKFQAIAEDKLADTRLVNAGPRSAGQFGFDFSGGPIPYIAEYLFQFIGARDEDEEPSNYAEIEVIHHEFGPMTLTLQRHSGKTPHQLRQAAEAKVAKLEEALKPFLPADATMEELLWGDMPDEATGSVTVTLGDFRRALNTIEGGGR